MLASFTQFVRRASATSGALTDATVVAYAAWTVAANLAVLSGGNTHVLVVAAAGALLALLGLGTWLGARPGVADAYFADLADDPTPPERSMTARGPRALLVMPLVTLVTFVTTRSPWLGFAGMTLSSLVLAGYGLNAPLATDAAAPATSDPARAASERRGLYLLAFLSACFTLLAVRPRSDDTFYLSMASSVVEEPLRALLSVNLVHGPPSATLGLQPMFPPYRVHSFELLGGLVSYVSGIDTVRVIHFLLASAFGWLVPFALARLFRVLAPRQVLFATAVVVSFYWLEGSASRGYANHAFVRLWHGKGVLLTAFVPLICAYGLRFGVRATRVRFALLAAAQVAAMGLSSTGIWLAPTLALLSVVAGTPNLRVLGSRLLGSVLSSGYVLAAGAWVMVKLAGGARGEPADVDTGGDALTPLVQVAISNLPPLFARIADAIRIALGPLHTSLALLGAALAGAALAPNLLGLRLLAALLCALCLGFANPWLSSSIANGVTGVTTYYRIFWLLPIPIALALAASGVQMALRVRARAVVALVSSCVLLAGFYALAIDRLVISLDNQSKLAFPPVLKLPPHARAVARATCAWAPRGAHVLASTVVQQQLPIVQGCGYPLIAADRWLSASPEEKAIRNELVSYVQGSLDLPADKAHWFLDQLAREHIDAIVLTKETIRSARTKSLIRLAGFDHVELVEWEHIYTRMQRESLDQFDTVARTICAQKYPSPRVLAPFGVAEAVEAKGCGTAITSPSKMRALSGHAFESLLALERLAFYVPSDFNLEKGGWLRRAFDERGIDTIVVSVQSYHSSAMRILLARAGFVRITTVAKHVILRRPPQPIEP